MKDLRTYVEMIVSGLDCEEFEQYGEHEEFQEDIDTIAKLLDDPTVGENVIMAYLKFWENSGANVYVGEIPRALSDHYRGAHTSAAMFIQAAVEETADSAKKEFLREYGDWIDWEGLAQAPDYSSYMFITLPESEWTYAFRD